MSAPSEIEKLKALRAQGTISWDEFEAAREKLLNRETGAAEPRGLSDFARFVLVLLVLYVLGLGIMGFAGATFLLTDAGILTALGVTVILLLLALIATFPTGK